MTREYWDEKEEEYEESFGPHYSSDSDSDSDLDFAHPGGNSALRAETESNPRNLPCPTCKKKNRLTPADRRRGYQCDSCADRAERGSDY